eukprot:comp17184_c2_seq1/m.16061 comp17184_c2_seq1/g.16061  ORF comp17184_c2_seq1/g.16061 comp17184_c2_seq1/m.16061 type:complete len:129 (-) comp17184_c2_seq1:961-1347(-)
MKHVKLEPQQQDEGNEFSENALWCTTDNFLQECMVGVGQFGLIYKYQKPGSEERHILTGRRIINLADDVDTQTDPVLVGLTHPNVATVLGYSKVHGIPSTLVYDLAEYRTLERILKPDSESAGFHLGR